MRTLLKLQFYDSTFSLILISRKILSQLHILMQIQSVDYGWNWKIVTFSATQILREINFGKI